MTRRLRYLALKALALASSMSSPVSAQELSDAEREILVSINPTVCLAAISDAPPLLNSVLAIECTGMVGRHCEQSGAPTDCYRLVSAQIRTYYDANAALLPSNPDLTGIQTSRYRSKMRAITESFDAQDHCAVIQQPDYPEALCETVSLLAGLESMFSAGRMVDVVFPVHAD